MTDVWPAIEIRPRRLGHVNLFVTSVECSLLFYGDVCGFEQVFEEPQILAVFLGNGNTHHDLALMGVAAHARVGRDGHVQVASGRGSAAGLNHLGFEIETEADLAAAIERAEKASFEFHRIVDHQISHSVYFFDPDGNYIEVYADVTRDWRRLYENSRGQLVTGSWRLADSPLSTEPMYESQPEIHVKVDALLHPTHVARATLVVADLERSKVFYERVVGLRTITEYHHLGGVVLGGTLGHPDLALIQQSNDEDLGLHHLSAALPLAVELDIGIARLRAAGIDIEEQFDGPSIRSIVVRDPDGVRIEFFIPSGSDSSRVVIDRHYIN